MKKKYVSLLLIIFILFIPIIIFKKTSIPDRSSVSIMEDWGKIIKKYHSQKTDSDIFAKGKHSIILKKDIEQAKEFYLLTGLSEQEALESAIKSEFEREALYQAAKKHGFNATRTEVEKYIQELQKSIEESANKEDVEAVIAQFESPEQYWKYQIAVYEKELPIQNYIKNLEKKYNETTNKEIDNWNDYFQQLKDNLVKKENFQIF